MRDSKSKRKNLKEKGIVQKQSLVSTLMTEESSLELIWDVRKNPG